ncbi:MAG TPA: protein kinase [Polyangiales bacterium]|nr:protein kinase [Polyangiales bacterium]
MAGRYFVEEVLGRGGMATVYRVHDRVSGQHRALKRVRPQGTRSILRRQQLLEREYHTLAQLAHPSIIAVYDFGQDEHGPFYTMELLDGADLASLGRVDWTRACGLLRDVASSLAILHSRGLLHRDVSARNVRCSERGLAKLIDFGALCSIGVDLDVVGTPPFIAPEAVQMQALDARVDLFALGALGYYLITGRHAFPARQLRDLRDAWRSAPIAPQRFVADMPAALNQLILELLTLDRNARPQSAGEVMRRLCSIAQLPVDEDIAVSRAYLATPALVGREQASITARKQMLSLVRGDGHTLLIEGAAGSGRSRMLDATVLEGKMMGALVVRAHAIEGTSADWAVARSMTSQLTAALPDKVETVSRLSRDVISHVVDAVEPSRLLGPPPERSLLIRELRDFVLALSIGQRLLIVIDDVDRIDEPSLALLAALANKTERHPLVLVLAAVREVAPNPSASMRLLRSVASLIELRPFTPGQTEALLRSVFGDVPNQPFVAAHIHRLAQGSPRTTMELAEHLVERGLCRYLGGTWSLPSALNENDLPSSLAESLETRLRTISSDAALLCEALSIAQAPALSAVQLTALTPGWSPERVYAGLHELVGIRVLVEDAEYYRFQQRGYVPVARALMTDLRRRELHGRMADLVQSADADPLLLAHHLLEAGRDDAALAVIQSLDARVRHPPVALLERAIEHAQARDLPARSIEEMRMNLLTASAFALDVATFRRVAPGVLARLVSDSGLALYQSLDELAPAERLSQALQRTAATHAAMPEHARGFPVEDAIRKLARLSNAFTIMGVWTYDLGLLEEFPALSPLTPLSPAIVVMHQLVEAAKDLQSGRSLRAIAGYESVLQRITEDDLGGLEPVHQTLVRAVCLILLGMLEASAGIARFEQRAQQLENDRAFRANAWRMRQAFALTQGDDEQARRSMRRAELLQLQEGVEQQAHGGSDAITLLGYVRTQDLVGIERALAELAPLAKLLPDWQPTMCYGQSARLRLHGDPQAALDALLPAFERALPGRHRMFGSVAAAHVQLLTELGRVEEAIDVGAKYWQTIREQDLVMGWEVRGPLGLALAQRGRADEGLRLIQDWQRDQATLGQSGIMVGTACEASARICLQLGDRAGFDREVARCANAYKTEHNPVLSARLARLIAEANGELSASETLDPQQLVDDAAHVADYETIYSRMRECVDRSDRARCALTLLLQQTERFAGYVFGFDGGVSLTLMAALPDEPSRELSDWASRWFAGEVLTERSDTTADAIESPTGNLNSVTTSARPPSNSVSERYHDTEGRLFEASLMTVLRDLESVTVGVLISQIGKGARLPNRGLLSQIGALMLEHGDVKAVALESVKFSESNTE